MVDVKPFDKLEDFLICSNCLGPFDDPRILPCHHTFCAGCLMSWISKTKQGEHFICPQCLVKVAIPNTKNGDFPKHTVFMNLLCVSANQRAIVRCEMCTGNDIARARCITCSKSLCKHCEYSHDRLKAVFKGHQVKTMFEISRMNLTELCKLTPEKCPKHTDENLIFYCVDCSEAICLHCQPVYHNLHECKELSAIHGETKTDIISVLNKLQEHTDDCRKDIKLIDSKIDDVKKTAKSTVTVIAESEQKTLEYIKQYYNDLKSKVQVFAEEEEQKRTTEKKSLETKLSSMMSAIDLGSVALNYGRPAETASIKIQLKTALEPYKRTPRVVREVLYKPGDIDILQIDSILGTLVYETSTGNKLPPSNQLLVKPQQLQRLKSLSSSKSDMKNCRAKHMASDSSDTKGCLVTGATKMDPVKCATQSKPTNQSKPIKLESIIQILKAPKQQGNVSYKQTTIGGHINKLKDVVDKFSSQDENDQAQVRTPRLLISETETNILLHAYIENGSNWKTILKQVKEKSFLLTDQLKKYYEEGDEKSLLRRIKDHVTALINGRKNNMVTAKSRELISIINKGKISLKRKEIDDDEAEWRKIRTVQSRSSPEATSSSGLNDSCEQQVDTFKGSDAGSGSIQQQVDPRETISSTSDEVNWASDLNEEEWQAIELLE